MLSRSYVQAGAGGVSGVFLIDTFTKNVRPSARTLGPALAPPHPGLLNTIFSKLNNGPQLQLRFRGVNIRVESVVPRIVDIDCYKNI